MKMEAIRSRMAGEEWWRGCTIYQIYPRSFQDTNDDGIGDLRGVVQRLPHVASLGVDAIWISPFFRSPMADMGYDVSDYCDVDPLFGSLGDFDMVVGEAHRLGLKVIIDQVLSHSSDRHAWFVESRSSRDNPRSDWYVWADPRPDGTPPNNWLSVFGGPAWEWDSVRKQYYLHNFLTSQPDLNFHCEAVQGALLETVEFWLKRGVDGFRFDAINFCVHDALLRDNPPVPEGKFNDIPDTNPYGYQEHLYDKTQPENLIFLKRLRALLDRYGARASIGEVGDGPRSLKTVGEYTSGNDRLNMCYTFDMLSHAFSAAHVRGCITAFETAVSDGWICWALSNHDVMRHVSRWTAHGHQPDAVARFAIALLVSMRGSICLYQGEELGLLEADLDFEDLRDPYGIRFWPGFKGRDGCRTPMVWDGEHINAGFSKAKPWLPVPAQHLENAVALQEADAGSILHHYRTMLRLRAATPLLVDSPIAFVEGQPEDVLVFTRGEGEDRIVCAFNFTGVTQEAALPGGNCRALDMRGATAGEAGVSEGRIVLPPLGWFFGRVA